MISLRTIVRGMLVRFLPGLVVGTAVLYGLARLSGPVYVGWLRLAIANGKIAIGYAAVLVLLRYRLRTDADVAGRRSAVAGLLVPAAYLCGITTWAPLTSTGPFSTVAHVAIGAALAVGIYFPWLKRNAVPALTDQELRGVLGAGSEEWMDLGRSPDGVHREKSAMA